MSGSNDLMWGWSHPTSMLFGQTEKDFVPAMPPKAPKNPDKVARAIEARNLAERNAVRDATMGGHASTILTGYQGNRTAAGVDKELATAAGEAASVLAPRGSWQKRAIEKLRGQGGAGRDLFGTSRWQA